MKLTVRLILALLASAMLGAALAQTLNAQAPKPAPAFYIIDIVVNDAQTFAPYAAGVAATLEPFGGRFVARGGKVIPLQGEPPKG